MKIESARRRAARYERTFVERNESGLSVGDKGLAVTKAAHAFAHHAAWRALRRSPYKAWKPFTGRSPMRPPLALPNAQPRRLVCPGRVGALAQVTDDVVDEVVAEHALGPFGRNLAVITRCWRPACQASQLGHHVLDHVLRGAVHRVADLDQVGEHRLLRASRSTCGGLMMS